MCGDTQTIEVLSAVPCTWSPRATALGRLEKLERARERVVCDAQDDTYQVPVYRDHGQRAAVPKGHKCTFLKTFLLDSV